MSSLLPPNATRLERALETSSAQRLDLPVPVRQLWSPDECPVNALPWLAWSLSVDEWSEDWSVDQKRMAIANAVEVHRVKGTVGAVKRAVAALGYDVEVDEQTGQVYTFNVRLVAPTGDTISTTELDAAERLANSAKNARSHLLNVGPVLHPEVDLVLQAAALSGEFTTLWPDLLDLIELEATAVVLVAEQSVETTHVRPFRTDTVNGQVTAAIAAVGTYSLTLTASTAA